MRNILFASAMLLPAVAVAAPAGVTLSPDKTTTIFHGTPGRQALPQWHAPAGKIRIFDTFGPKHAYNANTGWTVANAASQTGSQQWFAFAVTPKTSATVTEIAEAVSSVSGTNSVTIALLADNAGVPGAVLDSKTLNNLQAFGNCCVVAVAHLHGGIQVSAGTTYWVAAILPKKKQSTTWDAWNYSTKNTSSGPAAYYGSAGWTAVQAQYSAFAIYGQ